MQQIGLQIEFSAVASALSGGNPCPYGARVLPPIPSGLARHGKHRIDENKLADRHPFADDSRGERSKRLSNEGAVCPLSDDGDRFALSLLQQCHDSMPIPSHPPAPGNKMYEGLSR